MFKFTSIILSVFLIGGCVSQQTGSLNQKDRFSLEQVLKLKPGKTRKEQIKKLFGAPDEKMDLSKFQDSELEGELWDYKDGEFSRLYFSFAKNSPIVDSITWEVFDGEPEQNLQKVQQKFPTAKWQIRDVPWVNPHAGPDKRYYEDKKVGISITFQRRRQEVSAFSWWDPSRGLANSAQQNEKKRKKFCIGEACAYGPPQ